MSGLNTARAFKMLHDPEYVGNLNTEAYLDLCLAAGYSQEASEKAAADWGFKRIKSGLNL
jgi:hypothetical protein